MIKRRVTKTGKNSAPRHKGNTARSKPVHRKRGSADIREDPIAVRILSRVELLGAASFESFAGMVNRIAAPSTIRKKLSELKAAGLIEIARDYRGSGRPMKVHLLPKGEKLLEEIRKDDRGHR